tara:strand:+ start:369 stop:1601 length:1233 start_codon:yes stop_codon:yes gene_type:complete
LNKFLILPLVFSIIVSSDDLKIAEDFKEGDIVSAETFNQIFDTIEKINRTVKTEDLIGTWSCDAMTTRETSGWINKGLYYSLEGAQVNFSDAVSGTESAKVVTTSSPSPFKRVNSSFTGEFVVLNNKLFTKDSGETDSRIYDINFISDSRFELTFLETSAQSFPANYASFLTCDSSAKVPAAPTLPSAVNNKATITLAWTDVSVDETGFKIYRKIDGSSEYTLISTQTETSYSDSDTSEGTKYFYYIVSYNDNGDSAKSLIISATADTIAPTAIASSPANNETVGRQLYEILVEFSEKVEIVCPAGDQYGGMIDDTCPTSGGAITFTANIEGSSRTPSLRYPTLGTGGSKTLRLGTMGSAERFDANQNNIEVTINKDWIRDANGNQMTSDFSFSFNVDATLQNPGCPPSC